MVLGFPKENRAMNRAHGMDESDAYQLCWMPLIVLVAGFEAFVYYWYEADGCVRVCRSFGTLSLYGENSCLRFYTVNHQGTQIFRISLVIACKLLVGRVGRVIGCWTSVNRVRAT